jgi:hypothetical protein
VEDVAAEVGATLKEVLLKRKADIATEPVELDAGVVVKVRGLTNGEVRACREKAKEDKKRYEHLLVSAGMVDPKLTEAEVGLWLEGDPDDPDDVGAPAGDAVQVMSAIQRLSGLSKEDATKSVPPVRKPRARR